MTPTEKAIAAREKRTRAATLKRLGVAVAEDTPKPAPKAESKAKKS